MFMLVAVAICKMEESTRDTSAVPACCSRKGIHTCPVKGGRSDGSTYLAALISMNASCFLAALSYPYFSFELSACASLSLLLRPICYLPSRQTAVKAHLPGHSAEQSRTCLTGRRQTRRSRAFPLCRRYNCLSGLQITVRSAVTMMIMIMTMIIIITRSSI